MQRNTGMKWLMLSMLLEFSLIPIVWILLHDYLLLNNTKAIKLYCHTSPLPQLFYFIDSYVQHFDFTNWKGIKNEYFLGLCVNVNVTQSEWQMAQKWWWRQRRVEAFWMKKKSLTDVVEQSRIATELPPFSSL